MENSADALPRNDWLTPFFRLFSWCVIATLLIYLINNYLNLAYEWPGAGAIFSSESGTLGWVQTFFLISDTSVFLKFYFSFVYFRKTEVFSTEKSKTVGIFFENYNHLTKTSVFLKFFSQNHK